MKTIFHTWILFIVISAAISSCHPAGGKKTGGVQDQVAGNTELIALDEKIISDSLDPENYYLRSKYYLEQKEINKSLADISRAIQLDGKKSDYFVTLADIYLAMDRIPSSLEALKKAEKLDPSNSRALVKLARTYLILKDYKSAFDYTGRALDIDRQNPEAYFVRGYAYMEQGDTSLAIRNFQAAADQDQNYYDAFIQLGSLYTIHNNPVAAGYLETATRIDSNRAEGYYLLGLAYQEQEKIPQAIKTYEKLLKKFPDFKEAEYNLGYVNLVYTKDFEKAATYFSRAIAQDPKYTDAYFNRGYSYELMGDYTNARKDYEKALELEPNYDRPINGLNRLDSLTR